MELSIQHDLWWGTELRLLSWSGYQSRRGPYGSKDKTGLSDGTVALVFAPEARGLEPLTQEELGFIAWFEQNEPAVSAAVKAAILEWCLPESRDRAERFDFGDDFPVICNEQDLRESIGLYGINIHQLGVCGVPYVGYEFGCEWEEEHGLGVLLHGTRLVELGFADTAIHLWVAEADAERVGAS